MWLKLSPMPNELLSSYLSRYAYLYGLSPTRFCTFHLGRFKTWNCDIDRNASEALLHAIANQTGLSFKNIQAMMLPSLERTCHSSSSRKKSNGGVATGILAVGIRNRARLKYGLQYCPNCLREAAYFRRTWRVACITMCRRHMVHLLDTCSACDQPITLHQQRLDIQHCHQCGADLALNRAQLLEVPETHRIQKFQCDYISALDGHSILVAQKRITPIDFLVGIHQLLRFPFTRWWNDRPRQVAAGSGTQFEKYRRHDRQIILGKLCGLIYDFPNAFFAIANKYGVTQRTFAGLPVFPKWIQSTINLLPTGKSYDRERNPRLIRRQLRSLHRYKRSEWRSQRATLLLQVAGYRAWL